MENTAPNTLPSPATAASWIEHLFASEGAVAGGVVVRRSSDVERYAGRERLLAEVAEREYHAIENAGMFVIFCNSQPLRLLQ